MIQLKTSSENSCRFTQETGAEVLQVPLLGILPMALGLAAFSPWPCAFVSTAARFHAHLGAHWQGAIIRRSTININYSEG